jgi:mannose-1-phosphate guanylyltransferase
VSNLDNLHVIVLAGGNDGRLVSLTQALSGAEVPKQFAVIAGDGSLLQQTVARFAGPIPERRIVVMVAAAHEELARTQLKAWRSVEIIARPSDGGSAPDLLVPLGRVLARCPDADVVVAPAEHYVPRPAPLLRAVHAAAAALPESPVVVVGVNSERGGTDRPWIVPGRRLGNGLFSVAGLVAKPSPAHVERLLTTGALWNTSILVASGRHLWRQLRHRLPRQAEAVAGLWRGGDVSRGELAAAYQLMPRAELDADFLCGIKNLAVVPVSGSGWIDWVSPEHVIDSLQQPGELESLLSRIFWRQRALGAPRPERRAGAGQHHATAA